MKSLPVVVERKSPTHRAFQLLGVLAVFGFYFYVVNVVENFSAIRWAIAVTLSVAILGLNIVTGYSGQISIGHSAFFGIGAYTTMILIADHGWPFLATLPVAGALELSHHRRCCGEHRGCFRSDHSGYNRGDHSCDRGRNHCGRDRARRGGLQGAH